MNKEDFIKSTRELGIELTTEMLLKLEKYYYLLTEWNEKINLTTITKEEDVYLKHFYDSLTLIKEIDLNKNITLCDVGSGAGFPGIVLKIVFPNSNIVLIDSLRKRVDYLNIVIKELELDSIEAVHFRMEDYSKDNEEKFDYITARAVSDLSIITEISLRALKINGKLVFMKSNAEEEINKIRSRLKDYGLIIENINTFELPFENSIRTLITLKKVEKTNKKYPRQFDKIKKS